MISKSYYYYFNSESSFQNVRSWLKELRLYSNPDIQIFLIGNKCDLEEKRVVSTETARKLAEEENIKVFMESSAKSGFNAQKVFIEAGKELFSNYQVYSNRRSSRSSIDSSPVEAYNNRVQFPSQANVSGKVIGEKKKDCSC